MSIAASKWVRTVQVPDISAAAVLLYLANCHNDQTGLCCPSQKTIADFLHCDLRTVVTALNRLKSAGIISWQKVPSKTGSHNEYSLLGVSEGVPSFNEVTPSNEVTSPNGVTSFNVENQQGSPHPMRSGVTSSNEVLIINNKEKEIYKDKDSCTDESDATSPPTTSSSEPTLFDLTKKKTVATMLTLNELPPAWKLYCITKRPDLDPEATFIDFKFYWKAQGAKKMRNWQQTWQGWVRRQGNVPVRTAEKPPDVSEQTWKDFLGTRKTPFTETALKQLLMEVAKCPELSLEQALIYTVGKGWKTFDAGYYKQNKSYSTEDQFSLTDFIKQKRGMKQ